MNVVVVDVTCKINIIIQGINVSLKVTSTIEQTSFIIQYIRVSKSGEPFTLKQFESASKFVLRISIQQWI